MKKIIIVLFIIFNLQVFSDAKIFVFHRFNDNRYPSTNISTKKLRTLFEYLIDNNYMVVQMKYLIYLLENEIYIPDNYIVLSIDDGYKSFYENGLDVFKEYNYPFTIFINTKATNDKYKDYVTWDQIKEISKYGEIGSHSYSHPHLVNLSFEEIQEEISNCIIDLENKLGIEVKYFSYPYGEYNSFTKSIVRSYDFKAIFNQNNGAISDFTNIYDMDRIALTEDSNIKSKFIYKYLDVEWINEDEFVNTSSINKIQLQTDKKINLAEIYLTGYSWEKVKLEDGYLNIDYNKKLTQYRNRLIIRTFDNRYNTKVIINKEIKPTN